MKKLLSLGLLALLGAFAVGCGGSGGGDNNQNDKTIPTISSVFDDFLKTPNYVIYMSGYDGLALTDAENFVYKLDAQGFDCEAVGDNADCEKRNISNSVLYLLGAIRDSDIVANKYQAVEMLVSNQKIPTIYNNLENFFPSLKHRQMGFSTDYCYDTDISVLAQAYLQELKKQGFIQNSKNDRFYYKEVDGLVYEWGYSYLSIAWGIYQKNYFLEDDSMFSCEYHDL